MNKKMTIESMKIDFFKGIEHFEIDFSDKTAIEGANETGKTTLYDAFCYCLTGKNSKGETTFGIKPNFSTEMVSPSVEIECNIFDKPVNFKRVYQAKFAKDGTFKKYQTECFINGLPKTVSDFESYIADNIADNELFKLLTNPKYFTEQITLRKGETITMRQRNMLFGMSEMITDKDIIKANKQFAPLFTPLERYQDVSEYKRFLKATISKIKIEVDNLPIRIDQQAKNFLILNFSEKEVKKKLTALLSERDRLNDELNATLTNPAMNKIRSDMQDVQRRIKELMDENNTYVYEQRQKSVDEHLSSVLEAKDRIAELQKKQRESDDEYYPKLVDYRVRISNGEKVISELAESVKAVKREREKCESQHMEIAEKCPTCGRPYDENSIKASTEAAEKAKREKLASFDKAIAITKSKIAAYKEKLEEVKKEFEELSKNKADYSKEIAELTTKVNYEPPEVHNLPDYEEKLLALNAENDRLSKEAEKTRETILTARATLEYQIRGAENTIEYCKSQLAQVELNKNCQRQIDMLEEQRQLANKQLDELQASLDIADEFIKFKCNLATEKVNSMFEHTKWKLFDFTQEGNIFEICVPVFNGTEYKDLSASTKIMCGLDIIKAFQNHYGLLLPIFIDEKETITESVELPCQFITLSAVEENCPNCGSETGRKQENGLWKCKNCGHEFKKSLKIIK